MINHGTKSKKGYGYTLVVMDKLGKYGCGKLLKKIPSRTISNQFADNTHKSNRKPRLTETDDGNNFKKFCSYQS